MRIERNPRRGRPVERQPPQRTNVYSGGPVEVLQLEFGVPVSVLEPCR